VQKCLCGPYEHSYGPLLSKSGKVIIAPTSHRLVKGGVAVKCAEVKTREAAEGLKSTKLYVPRENFPAQKILAQVTC